MSGLIDVFLKEIQEQSSNFQIHFKISEIKTNSYLIRGVL